MHLVRFRIILLSYVFRLFYKNKIINCVRLLELVYLYPLINIPNCPWDKEKIWLYVRRKIWSRFVIVFTILLFVLYNQATILICLQYMHLFQNFAIHKYFLKNIQKSLTELDSSSNNDILDHHVKPYLKTELYQ